MGMMHQGDSLEELRTLTADGFYQTECYSPWRYHRRLSFAFESSGDSMLPVTRLVSDDVGVKRRWSDIRDNSSSLYLIWFPVAGSLRVTQDKQHDGIIRAGDFVVTCGDRPFDVRAMSNQGERASQLHISVPSHVMRSIMPNIDNVCGLSFSGREGGARIAQDIIDGLIDVEANISSETNYNLRLAAIHAIGDSIKSQVRISRPPIRQEHLDRILRYIDENYTCPELTAEIAARACGITPRYLHSILHAYDLSYKREVAVRRLREVARWESEDNGDRMPLKDIVYFSGFSSFARYARALGSYGN